MILVKKCKFPPRLFQEKMGLEVVFDDYIDRKQALLDYKNMDFKIKIWISHSRHIGFLKGVKQPIILVKKLEISCLSFFFGTRGLELMLDDRLVREQAFLDHKSIGFT